MIDLHCHLLPGVDDGAATLAEAVAMARFCVADGMTHVAATPHCHRSIRLLREAIVPRVAALNAELEREEVPLTVLPGSEIQLFDRAAFRRDEEAGLYCHLGDGRRFTLLELPWELSLYPEGAPEHARWLRERGLTPILAHPERTPAFGWDANLLREWVEAGAWLQITVDSLLGNHGPGPQRLGWELLRAYPDAILATDAHNLRRCSGLASGYQAVRERLGAARFEDLKARASSVLEQLLQEKTADRQ
jgi:protein-tyrosine phosphatase